jgi:hypothetical protein
LEESLEIVIEVLEEAGVVFCSFWGDVEPDSRLGGGDRGGGCDHFYFFEKPRRGLKSVVGPNNWIWEKTVGVIRTVMGLT